MPSLEHDRSHSMSLLWWGLGAWLALMAGLVYILWRQKMGGGNIEPVHIDLSFIRRQPQAEPPEPTVESTPQPEPQAQPQPGDVPAEPAPLAEDDLTLLVGIGPKVAAVLRGAGFATFGRLAQADPAQLKEILLSAKLRLPDPATWPEQARLAAAGRWDDLKDYLARLRAGQKS